MAWQLHCIIVIGMQRGELAIDWRRRSIVELLAILTLWRQIGSELRDATIATERFLRDE